MNAVSGGVLQATLSSTGWWMQPDGLAPRVVMPVQRFAQRPGQEPAPSWTSPQAVIPYAPGGYAVRVPAPQGASGQALPLEFRRSIESAMGVDFSAVRLHAAPPAAETGAIAWTSGNQIEISPRHLATTSTEGQLLLARQLAYVVQQSSGRVRNPFGRGYALIHAPALEAEAEDWARQAVFRVAQAKAAPAHHFQTPSAQHAAGVIQRRENVLAPGIVTPTDGGASVNVMGQVYSVTDISMYAWSTGGKEKNIYRMSRDKAAAVSKTGDLRRIRSEVSMLRDLRRYRVPTISVSDVKMFRRGNRIAPGFVVDWIDNSIDSNADPVGFDLALRRLRPEQRETAGRDLDRVQAYLHTRGGILDLQALVDMYSGHLHVLDPREKMLETSGSMLVMTRWRQALEAGSAQARKPR